MKSRKNSRSSSKSVRGKKNSRSGSKSKSRSNNFKKNKKSKRRVSLRGGALWNADETYDADSALSNFINKYPTDLTIPVYGADTNNALYHEALDKIRHIFFHKTKGFLIKKGRSIDTYENDKLAADEEVKKALETYIKTT